jgi:hypothetical protein
MMSKDVQIDTTPLSLADQEQRARDGIVTAEHALAYAQDVLAATRLTRLLQGDYTLQQTLELTWELANGDQNLRYVADQAGRSLRAVVDAILKVAVEANIATCVKCELDCTIWVLPRGEYLPNAVVLIQSSTVQVRQPCLGDPIAWFPSGLLELRPIPDQAHSFDIVHRRPDDTGAEPEIIRHNYNLQEVRAGLFALGLSLRLPWRRP